LDFGDRDIFKNGGIFENFGDHFGGDVRF